MSSILCDYCKREHRDAWQDPEAVYCIREGGAWMGKKKMVSNRLYSREVCRWFIRRDDMGKVEG